MTKKFAKFRHIDTTGLPPKFDIADLVDSGVTGADLIAWLRDRVRDGPPPEEEPQEKKKKRTPARPTPGPAVAVQGNVAPLRQPEEEPEPDLAMPLEYSEDALAESFTERYRDVLVYCKLWSTWLHWQDNRWKKDDTQLALDLARKTCRKAAAEAEAQVELGNKRHAVAAKLSTASVMKNVAGLASSDRRQVVAPQQFDADPWLLNTPDGVIDLKTGKLRPADRGDWCTKQTAVGPSNEDCPVWKKFLRDCSDDDPELIRYLQRVSGYCLTGSISEHVFFFAYGTGRNGKGTWMNQLFWMLADYAIHAQMSTFTQQRFEKHASEIAYFEGARVVTASETTAGSRWHEQRIKSFTGGDPITANWMRENPFTFLPQFKLLFAGNTKPHLRNVDPAIKARMFLIPFDVFIPEDKRDQQLPLKLQAEGAAILRWCIEGCLDWQENSLDPPDRVIATTQDYFDSEDKIGSFLDDCVGFADDQSVRTTYLFERYTRWAEAHREYVPSHKVFLDMMETKGYRPVKAGSESLFKGLFIVYDEDSQPGQAGGIPF